ncbi:helix-turn-helix domain-containing protein [Streptomyces sp. UNOC14_S4]|uniref:AraC-like ligand-binding domain-containing protein n=1 Tax=Streptomyces sp. UNOC14_S4 TaxID=2872340 RepID=UPI001E534A45|nr:helix-turn-helix domain-containing protein [Streptomyces sp. UNOC14_S4]MCC3767705.1 helix-turn-helix domain-containing protein [Streptomyces sp. UNOC14_S4]
MLDETTLRTEDLPAADRFGAWQEWLGNTHAPMSLSSDHSADYRGRLRLVDVGSITIWPASFQQLVFRRSPKLIRQSDPEAYHLTLLLRGEGRAMMGKQDNTYVPYDIHTSNTSRPYEIHAHQDEVTMVGLEVPKQLVLLPREKADRAAGRKMSGHEGFGALLAQLLRQLSNGSGAYRPTDIPHLEAVIGDLTTALFARTLDTELRPVPETRGRLLTLAVKEFVRRHLHDPELTPTRVAEAHHISVRYLHRLFEAESTTAAGYIRQQRLQGAWRELTSPALRDIPVHAISARWGFTHHASFSRAFLRAYGLSPMEARFPLRTDDVPADEGNTCARTVKRLCTDG